MEEEEEEEDITDFMICKNALENIENLGTALVDNQTSCESVSDNSPSSHITNINACYPSYSSSTRSGSINQGNQCNFFSSG